MRLSGPAAARLAGDACGDPGLLDRCGGRAAALVAVRATRAAFGPAADRVLAAAGSVGDLLVRAAGLLLATVPADGRRRLGLAVYLEHGERDDGPWWQHLTDDGHPDAAPVRLRIDDHERAAQAMAANADRLMDLGQWQTLEGWLARLNRDVLADHPDLIRARGEIAAARGDAPHAQTWFDLAAARSVARGDTVGACSTMLAASTVATTSLDLATARVRAAGARSLADVADRPACQLWTGWQLAAVHLLGGDDAALLAFARLAEGDGQGDNGQSDEGLIATTARLSRQVLDLRRDRERHRQALAERVTGPSLIVQLLGPILAAVGDTPVEEHLGSRARSLLAYLVTHRDPAPATEALVEALWPDVAPGRGRNSLHVAVHGLRRAIRTATDAPVVVHAGGCYRLHPAVTLWTDVDEFDCGWHTSTSSTGSAACSSPPAGIRGARTCAGGSSTRTPAARTPTAA
ncbi:hypothetical protein Voc01_065650 [Virgisporangium ochraceum]|uniref:OmpR/PhoB-type domain-containing protein n=1 Tax=Virgisporangium ochraceum TaxID=65505 RepID=A0A8J4A0F2_9ACTN|nr:winged helix-turn-helix domain-containing protein [Virgisporangium ochraceum]GIJ71648.1 hypothetical protein Voc01_065650 [Virgisporangium ochraceum]